jgi:hypothetical protein
MRSEQTVSETNMNKTVILLRDTFKPQITLETIASMIGEQC